MNQCEIWYDKGLIFIRIFGGKKIEFRGGSFLAYLQQGLLETQGKRIDKNRIGFKNLNWV